MTTTPAGLRSTDDDETTSGGIGATATTVMTDTRTTPPLPTPENYEDERQPGLQGGYANKTSG